MESRGFAAPVTERTVRLAVSGIETVELAVNKTSTKLKGVVYSDSNGNGELDDEDRLVAGVAVLLDGDEDNVVVTNAEGQFAFRDVPFGHHEIYVVEAGLPEGEEPLNLLVPFTLARTEKAEVYVAWPYDLGPEEGFLQVDVEKGQGE